MQRGGVLAVETGVISRTSRSATGETGWPLSSTVAGAAIGAVDAGELDGAGADACPWPGCATEHPARACQRGAGAEPAGTENRAGPAGAGPGQSCPV
jgi:hypothetical protein